MKLPFFCLNAMIKLSNRKLFRQFFQRLVVGLVCLSMVLPTSLVMAQSQHVVPDGRTQTAVTSNSAGTMTDVRTNTIRGTTGYNSFDRFNVPGGNTTNLYVPDGAKSLVNLVHNERTQIDGILNSYKNGNIGGNVFFLNPHGIAIGAGGVVNVGSLHLQTPTQDYMKQLMNEHGQISAVHEQMLFDGKVPISPSGLISVKGTINAVEEVNISAGEVDLARGSRVRAGHQVQVEFGNLVNVEGVNSGNALIKTPDGKIRIVAAGDVAATGEVSVDAVPSENAGQIEILAGNDININAGAEITARGVGTNSDGGEVVIVADQNSNLQDGAVVDVSAKNGKGGFLEFSAKDTVKVEGNGLRSSYGGTILIDPSEIVWTGSGSDVFQKGVEYKLEADNLISLTDVYISTRNVNDTGLTGAAKRNAHLSGASTGNSGNIILSAPIIELTNSYLLTHATGTYEAGNISLLAGNSVTLTNTLLDASAVTPKKDKGNVTISATDNELGHKFDVATARTNSIVIDKDSTIKGNDIKIEVITTAGTRLDDKSNDEELEDYGGFADTVMEILEGALDFIAGKIVVPVASFKGLDVSSKITIDGTLIAENTIDIISKAVVESSIQGIGVAGIFINVSVTLAESLITIGETARITSKNDDINIESVVKNAVEQDMLVMVPVNANPLDFSVGVGVLTGNNAINIVKGAQLTAEKGNIDITAATTRSANMSVTGGRNNSVVGLAIGVLVQNFDTSISIGGQLTALEIDVKAVIDVEDNILTAEMSIGDGWPSGTGGAATEFFSFGINPLKNKILGVIKDKTGKDLGADSESRDDFALLVGLGIMVDDIDTSITIGGDAVINAKNYLNVEALTTNTPVVIATASVTEYKFNKARKDTKKDKALTISLPVVVVTQNTKAVIEDGAKIHVGQGSGDKAGVSVSAKTEMPYNLDLYTTIADHFAENEIGSGIKAVLDTIFDENLGITSGLFNSWSQTATDTEELAIGLMGSVVVVNNTTEAKIGDNVVIDGTVTFGSGVLSGVGKPDVSVEAVADVQLGHVIGNICSFLYQMPTPANFKEKGAKETLKNTFTSMWGTGGESGVGIGLMFNWVENSAIAEVGAAVLDVNNLDVSAETKGFDLNIAIGASSTEEFGLNGSVSATVFQTDARARIAEGAKVTAAGDVNINAADRTILISIDGNLAKSNETAFGLSIAVPIAIRNIYAVWGNYPDSEDSPASIMVESVVGGDVNINAEALGVTATLAVAGAMTTEKKPDTDKKLSSPEETMKGATDWFNENKDKLDSGSQTDFVKLLKGYQESMIGGDSGGGSGGDSDSSLGIAGGVAVNLLIEEVCAGINGNVKISAKSFDIEAANKAIDAALVGGLVVQLGSGDNQGIAGAIGVNLLFGDTRAFVDTKNGTLTYTDTFNLEANREGYIGAMSASAAGSASSSGFEVAGSVSVASIKSDTLADIKNTTITKKAASTTGDMTVGAANRALIVNIAGGVAVGGNTSVGISIAVSNLTLDTRVALETATINARNLATTATTESLIVTIALGGGVSYSGDVGVGGTVAVVLSDSDTSVSIKDSTLTLSGNFFAVAWSDTYNGLDNNYGDLLDYLAENEGEDSDYLNDKGETVNFDKSDVTYDAEGNAVRNDTTEEKEVQLGLSARSPRIITAALAVGVGSKVGVGANIGVNLMTEETFVSISGSTITTQGTKGIGVEAKTEGGMIAVAVGVGASQSVGVAGNLGVNLVGGRTEVVLNESTLIANEGNVALLAQSTAGIINASLSVGAGGNVGVGFGFAYNMVAHSVAVDLNKATVKALAGDLVFVAENNSDLISALLSIGGGGTAGVGVSLAINTIGTIQLDDTDLESPKDTQDELGKKEDELDSLFSNVGNENSIGDVIGSARNRTEIYIKDSIVSAGQDIAMDASSGGGMISISAAVGGGGTAGVGVGAAYNSISGNIRVVSHNSEMTAQQNVIGSSQINNKMYSVVVGGGIGGTAGVGVSVGANVLKAANQIDIFSDGVTSASIKKGQVKAVNGDVVFKATNSGEVLGSSVAIAGGGVAGVAAALTVNVLKGTTDVKLTKAELIAGDSIVLDAETTNGLYAVTGSIAISGTASVGATIAVNDMNSKANIDIAGSALTADGNVLIHTNVDAGLLAVLANLAGTGGVAVAGGVTYNGIRSTSVIDIVNSSIDAKANKTSTFNGLASYYTVGRLSSAFTGKKGVGIGAYSHSNLDNFFFLVSIGGVAGVNVGVPVNRIAGTTQINLDNTHLNQTAVGAAAQDIIIEALTKTESLGVVASVAGSAGAAVSAVVDIHLLESLVETNIKGSNLKAAGNISIGSKNSDDTNTILIGVAVAAAAGVGVNAEGIVATSTVKTNLDGGTGVANTINAGNNLNVYAESLLDIFELNVSVAGGFVGVGVAFAVNNLGQTTAVNIGGKYNLISGNVLSVKAKGETIFAEHIDALGAGVVGVGGAMGLTFADSFTEIAFDGVNVSLQGTTINVKAEDIFTQELSQVGGFAVGAVGAAAGLNVLQIRNGAQVRGTVDMKGSNSIIVDAVATRNIEELYTIAGAAGAAGLAGTVCHITIGGAKGSNEGINDTLNLFKKADLGNSSTKRTDGIAGNLQNVPDTQDASAIARQSAAVVLGGNLEAPVVQLGASVNNNVNITAAGVGVGFTVGAGGALLFVNVNDNVTASFTGNALANDFSLLGQSKNNGHTFAIAGGGGILGLAGAGNWTTFNSNITSSLGANSVINASDVVIKSDQNFDNIIAETDAGAVGAVGVGGAGVTLSLRGDSIVNIAQGAKIYAPLIAFEALKNYNNVKADAFGLAGGLVGGAGVDALLKLDGNAKVLIANGAKLRTSATGNPFDYDEIYIGAGVNVANAVSRGDVDAGGLAVAAFGNTDVAMNFDTVIDIGNAELISGVITLEAYRETRASALHTTDTGGLGVAAGGISTLKLAGTNKINLSQSFIEAWNDLILSAGSGHNVLDAQTRVFNGGVIPVTGGKMVNATTDVAVANKIDMANSTLRAVRDIVLQTGQEDYKNVAYATTQYLYTGGGGGSFISDSDFSLKESSGTVKTNNANTIALATGNNLEAGIHWDTSITINNNGTGGVSVVKPDWATVDVTTGEVSMYTMLTKYTKQIQSLQDKSKLKNGFSAAEAAAYQAEIDYLTAQLAYYMLNPSGSLTDANNYAKAKLVQIGDITASAGDIHLITGTKNSTSNNSITAVAGNVLTANDSPQIVIVNNSSHFLEIFEADLIVPNPLDGGGRILVNGNNSASVGSATLHSNRNGSEPLISIKNTAGGSGSNLASELFLTSTYLFNPGGTTKLDSEGSIWLSNSNINARDVAISTKGSFYQNYQDGRVDIGGNPLASGSSISQAINQWISDRSFLSGGASLEILKAVLQEFATPETWNAVFGAGGSGNVSQLVAKSDIISQAMLPLFIGSYLSVQDSAAVFRNAFATYNDALTQLQDAATSESWATVFGSGTGNVSGLVAKPGRTLNISAYNAARDAYLALLSTAAEDYVASKVSTYGDARESGAALPNVQTGTYNWTASNKAKSIVDPQSAVTTAINASLPTITGDSIYGQRSVFIAAEMLNVNGTVHSGSLDFNIDLTTKAVTDAIAAEKTDLTQIVFGDKYTVASPKITYSGGTVTIDNIEAMGGNITLFGNIISTGNGKLLVEDGYGSISITAPETMNLVLGRVDTGLGADGTITIYDTSKGTATAPVKTVYTRENGQMKVNGADSSNYSYATTANRWLKNTLSTTSALSWDYSYDKDHIMIGWVDWTFLAKDTDAVTSVGGSVSLTKTAPVGTFLVTNAGLGTGNLYGTYSRTTTNPTEEYWYNRYDDTTIGSGHVYYNYGFRASQTFTETFSSYLNASHPIAIQFTGNETAGNVSITGAKNITLGNLVRAADAITVNTTGNIVGSTASTASPLMTAKSVTLSADNIGAANNALKLESFYAGTTLNATAKGNINLAVSNNPLLVNNVTGKEVNITSDADVLMKTGGSGISAANNLTVAVKSGKIAGQNDTNFKMAVEGNVKLSATGDIRIKHEGDLFVDQIATGQDGDLYVFVDGNIIDRNPVEVPDPLADVANALAELWAMLGLIGGSDAYNAKMEQKVKAYENEYTELYFEAWKKADYEADNYNPTYVYRYSSAQRAILLASDWTNEQIVAEENKRTQAYHNAFKSSYDTNYRYVASEAERSALAEYTAWTKEQLENAFNIPMFVLTQDAGTRNNTTSIMEDPNFVGRYITLTATGSIGSQLDDKVVIPMGISSAEFAKNDVWRRAVADAEWDDVVFGENDITITQYDDINIAASGWLKTFSRDGATYLGAQSDVVINEIVSGDNGTTKGTQPLRFKMDGNMLPFNVDQVSIYARNAILEAAGGAIGTVDKPIIINLTGGNTASGWITARGTEGVHLAFVDAAGEAATAYIREFGSYDGDITIIARAIVDALQEVQAAKIAGRNIVLKTSEGGLNIWLEQYIDGSMIVSVAGDATLTSRKSNLNFVSLIVGGDADIWAKGGGISFTDAEIDIAGDAQFTSVRSIALNNTLANFNNVDFEAVDDISFTKSTVETTGNMNQFSCNEIFVVSSEVTVDGNMLSDAGYDFTAIDSEITVLKNLFIGAGNDVSIVASSILAFDDLEAVALHDISIVDSDVWALENLSLVSLNTINQVIADVGAIGGTVSKIARNGVFDIRLTNHLRNMPLVPYGNMSWTWTEHMMKTANGVNLTNDQDDEDTLIDGYWLPENGQETLAVPVAMMN